MKKKTNTSSLCILCTLMPQTIPLIRLMLVHTWHEESAPGPTYHLYDCMCAICQYPWYTKEGFTLEKCTIPHTQLATLFIGMTYGTCLENFSNEKAPALHGILNTNPQSPSLTTFMTWCSYFSNNATTNIFTQVPRDTVGMETYFVLPRYATTLREQLTQTLNVPWPL